MRRRYMGGDIGTGNTVILCNLPDTTGGNTAGIFQVMRGWDSLGYADYINALDLFNDESLELIYSRFGDPPNSIHVADDTILRLQVDYDSSKKQVYVYKIKWIKGYFYVCLRVKGYPSSQILLPMLNDLGLNNILGLGSSYDYYITAYCPDL